MPRVEFSGKGDHIPEYAIPPFGSDNVIPPTVRTFVDSTDFSVQTYRDLGYTHFEVWCIGAAGGRGGGVQLVNALDPEYTQGVIPSTSYGGEGGGGGLHKIGGLLADLPDTVPVVVGKEGLPGQDGNRHYRWRTATAWMYGSGGWGNYAVTKGAINIPGMVDGSGNAIPPYFYLTDADTFPYRSPSYLFYPNLNYREPTDGGDGGASYFHDPPLAMASGGTGGKKSPVFGDTLGGATRIAASMLTSPGGEGGQGGIGNRLVAGGGGAGGTYSPLEYFDTPGGPFPPGYSYLDEKPRILTNAKDGFWDGVVGQGGGGGRGGTTKRNPNRIVPGGYAYVPPTVVLATDGGKGSFSFADTSVYGSAGLREPLSSVPGNLIGEGENSQVIPGEGGGARVLKNNQYGSRSAGYSPNGVVIVRLTRIVD